jgi:hypothetical protein
MGFPMHRFAAMLRGVLEEQEEGSPETGGGSPLVVGSAG